MGSAWGKGKGDQKRDAVIRGVVWREGQSKMRTDLKTKRRGEKRQIPARVPRGKGE